MFMRLWRCSLSFTCVLTTLSKLTRAGQGCEGYDTNRDTKGDLTRPSYSSRPKLDNFSKRMVALGRK